MGHQGEPNHPEVAAAVEDGLARIASVGGAAPGTLCLGDRAPHLIDLGVRFLYMSYDAWITQQGGLWLDQVRGAEASNTD
jgi:4-hydroxy-2-oxoheptanedioate aldolase